MSFVTGLYLVVNCIEQFNLHLFLYIHIHIIVCLATDEKMQSVVASLD